MSSATAQELPDFLTAHPEIDAFDLLLPDINGILRGVRVSREDIHLMFKSGAYMSASTMLLDSRGVLPDGLTIGLRDGDPDYCCLPVPGTLAPVPWGKRPMGQCLLQMYQEPGIPYYYDSRYVLERVLEGFRDLNLTPVVALELEFYLLDNTGDSGARPQPRSTRIPGSNLWTSAAQLHSLDDLYELDAFLLEVESACHTQGIPMGNIMSEGAPGQYEINLHHVADAVLACDHAVLLRRLVRGVARRHDLAATFMAKPFEALDGNGMHMHISLRDADGANLFAGNPAAGRPEGFAPDLRAAIGGVLVTMVEAQAIFAPNANSYRRLSGASYVSAAPSWGINHRQVAVRIPPSDDPNVRFEHRVAGADCNPYLALAAVLAGVHHGLTQKLEPPSMVHQAQILDPGEAPEPHWRGSLENFASAKILPRYLGEDFCRTYVQCRGLEAQAYQQQVPDLDYSWYLRNL
jgi:glutamine synthetase